MSYIVMKQKILFIMHMPPPVHGAAMVGQYIHDSKLINEKFEGHYINLTTAKNLQDIGKVGFRKFVDFVKLLRRIRKSLKTINPELVYVTPNACGGAFYKDYIVVQMIKRMGCQVVVHYHNKGVSTRQNRFLDSFLYQRFFKGIKVILLSECLYGDVKKYLKREDVFVCGNGIPDVIENSACSETVASDHIDGKVPHVLFLSNLLISKGVVVLLDSLKVLKEKGCRFVCDFVGGETVEMDAAMFQAEVAKRELEGMVVYHGRKYGNDKEAFLNAADMFVFPTFYHNECFPLVLLEAMQHHLPCVSTTEGGIPGIIDDGKTGFLVPKHDAETLAEKIQTLLSDADLRQRMGEAGREKYEKEFTLEVFEKRMAEILSDNVKC
mgnify:FL=1